MSLLVAEYFVSFHQPVLVILDDKEDALYTTAELEELCGKEHVLYFPATFFGTISDRKKLRMQTEY